MKSFIASAALAALIPVAWAAQCQNVTIPITISARNAVFGIQAPATNIAVTNLILGLTQQGKNYTQANLQGYQTVSGSYEIAATICNPDSGPSKVLQVLTHGIGFDRSYWDVPINNYNYSYVREAVDQYCYSTFAFDRLGIGMSSHGEPINEIQVALETAALAALTNMLRSGSCPSISQKWSKIVHVGHSFGSAQTYLLTAMYPSISDGIALTGFSQNGSFVPYFALGSDLIVANQVLALASYANGYLATSLPTGVQIDFFAPGMSDPNVLQYAYMTGKPVTVGELLTIGGSTATPNTFPGPVLVITGERDVPYCGGDCYGTGGAGGSIPQMALSTFVGTQNKQAIIVAGAGHGLNLEYSHPTTYGSILNFFLQNGLSP